VLATNPHIPERRDVLPGDRVAKSYARIKSDPERYRRFMERVKQYKRAHAESVERAWRKHEEKRKLERQQSREERAIAPSGNEAL
jgi:hypothetical protein